MGRWREREIQRKLQGKRGIARKARNPEVYKKLVKGNTVTELKTKQKTPSLGFETNKNKKVKQEKREGETNVQQQQQFTHKHTQYNMTT